MNQRRIDETELHAYVDGALPPERRAQIDKWLQGDADAALRVDAYRQQNRLLRAALDPMLAQPIPTRLVVGRRHRRTMMALRYGGMAASLLLAAGLGWFLRGEMTPRPVFTEMLAEHAAQAHLVYAPEVLHPVEVGADQEQHLLLWLSKRLGKPVRAPHLSALGFQLVGGRLLPVEGRPAAQFMYQDKQGRRLTLYVAANAAASEETVFRYTEDLDVSTFYWVERGVGYALSGQLNRTQLLPVARLMYHELGG